jgi:cell division protein FtsW (lipid II flippase)
MTPPSQPAPPRSAALLAPFAAASLSAVLLGAWICAANGVPAHLWARNLVAWGVGALAGWGLARLRGRRESLIVVAVAALALAATLFDPGQLGVHRWLTLGPLSVNAALLTLPAAIVALGRMRDRLGSWAVAAAILAILVAQPDASQATAFGAALVWIAWRGDGAAGVRVAAAPVAAALAAAAWFRPDPLQPVPEVEQIVELAYRMAPPLAAAALVSQAAYSLVPALVLRRGRPDERLAAGALSLYLALSAVSPWLGAFPVPLVGLGLSSVLGAWLGVGLLAGLSRERAAAR